MRILFMMTQDMKSPAGLGRYGPMAYELARRGHQVQMLALHSDFGSLNDRKQKINGVEVHYVAPMHLMKKDNQKIYYRPHQLIGIVLRATLALSWHALKSPADIIYIGKPQPMNSIAGLLTTILRGVPMVVDCDDYEAGSGHFSGEWQRKIVALFEKLAPRMAKFVTTHTDFMRTNLISWGVSPEKIVYLPNGIDRERFARPKPERVETERKRLNIEGKKVVAFIGTVSFVSHPVNLLLDAFAQLHRTIPNTALLIVGGGEDIPNLQQQAIQLGVEEATRIIGRVPPEDVPLYYALADVNTDPVYDDPVGRGRAPLKLLESWICGVPFVSAHVGERAHLMGTPPAGLLVYADQNQAEALANGIATVLSDSDLATTFIARGRERVKDFYWEPVTQILENCFFQCRQAYK